LNDRKLILNWYNFIDIQSGDFVGLYLEDPQVASEAVLNSPSESVRISSSASSGLHITSIKYDRQNLTAQSNHCVGYWIAYVRMNADSTHSVIKSKCLQIYPRWMDDLRSTIGDKPLNALMIPGEFYRNVVFYSTDLLTIKHCVSNPRDTRCRSMETL
jgi:hypothetical protein